MSSDVIVVGRARGADAPRSGSRRPARACSCSRRASGATHLARRDDRRARLRPPARGVDRPRRSGPAARRPAGSPLPRRRRRRSRGRRVVRASGSPRGRSPYAYTGEPDENLLLPTAVGVPRPSAIVPETMAGRRPARRRAGVRRRLPPMKDFHPQLAPRTSRRRGRASARPRRRARPAPSGRADVNALGRPAALDEPAFRGADRAARRRLRERRAGRRSRPCSGSPIRTRSWADIAASGSGRPVFEIPTLPPSVPGMRVFATCARRCGARAAAMILNAVVVGGRARGLAATGVRAGSGCARRSTAPTGWCSRPAASPPAALELDSTGRRAKSRSGCRRRRRAEAGEPRFAPGYFDEQPMARAGIAVDGELRPVGGGGERVFDNVLVAGATLAGAEPWKEKSGDGISLAPDTARPSSILAARPPRRPRHDDGGSALDGRPTRRRRARRAADARLARPLRQVHDLRDVLPGLERHAAVPGPEVRRARRPSASGSPTSRRPTRSLDYCSGCGDLHPGLPAGRPHRRDQLAGARAAQGATGFKLRDRIIARPTLPGRLGTPAAPIANWTLGNKPLRLGGEKVVGLHRDAPVPKFAGRTFQALGEEAPTRRPRDAARRLLPRLRRELLRAAARRDDRRAARAQRDRGRGPEAGLLRAAAPVQRHVRRRAQRTCTGWPSGSRRTRATGVDIVGTSTSCTLMLKREALEILGMGDDAELRGRLRARVRHLRVPARAARPRRAAGRTSRRSRETVIYHAPCQQQGHGIGKPALDLLALIPELTRGRERRDVLRRGRHVRAQEGEVRDRDEGRRGPVRADRRRRGRGSVCDSETCRWHIEQATGVAACTRSRCSTAPPGSPEPWSASSSSRTAPRWPRAWSSWRARWAARRWRSRPAGGLDDGRDRHRRRARAWPRSRRSASPDGVLVLMDLGSALMSAEMAAEMIDRGRGAGRAAARRRWSRAPSPPRRARAPARALDEVAAEARAALRDEGRAARRGRAAAPGAAGRSFGDGAEARSRLRSQPRSASTRGRPRASSRARARLRRRGRRSTNATRGTRPGRRPQPDRAGSARARARATSSRARGGPEAGTRRRAAALAADNFGDAAGRRAAAAAATGGWRRGGSRAAATEPPRATPRAGARRRRGAAPPLPPRAPACAASRPRTGSRRARAAARPPARRGRRGARGAAGRGAGAARRARARRARRTWRRRGRRSRLARARRRPRSSTPTSRCSTTPRCSTRRGATIDGGELSAGAAWRRRPRGRRRRLPRRPRRRVSARARRGRRGRRAAACSRHLAGAGAAAAEPAAAGHPRRRRAHARRRGRARPRAGRGASPPPGAAPTAHAAILARALGIPAVVGLGAGAARDRRGHAARARRRARAPSRSSRPRRPRRAGGSREARRGAPPRAELAPRRRARRARATATASRCSRTSAAPPRRAPAVEQGAEGVGLLRTEFLFLDRDAAAGRGRAGRGAHARSPRRSAAGRSSSARSTRAPTSRCRSCRQAPEDNPFLGVRGIRLVARAAGAVPHAAARDPARRRRASRARDVPDGRDAGGATAARAALDEARAELGGTAELEVGVMVEVPALALAADEFAPRGRLLLGRDQRPRRSTRWPPSAATRRSRRCSRARCRRCSRSSRGHRRRRGARPLGRRVRRARRRPEAARPARGPRRARAEHGRRPDPGGQGGAARRRRGRRRRRRPAPALPARAAGAAAAAGDGAR